MVSLHHQCYMRLITEQTWADPKEGGAQSVLKNIFFDSEATQEDGFHKLNLSGAQMNCEVCAGQSDEYVCKDMQEQTSSIQRRRM